jgi:NAD(P)H-dependent flavin oxidoreductase YrpB (nitropropane dioxygenase family)
VLSSATTVEEALWLEAHGADAIIAQGLEAGGHRGIFLNDDLSTQTGTFALLPRIVSAVRIPVIRRRHRRRHRVAAALALGAAGVQVGTAYMLCPEATTSPVHRAALESPDAGHTALTRLFTGRPARGIVNRFMRELGPSTPWPPPSPGHRRRRPLRAAAESQGSADFSPLWCGQNPWAAAPSAPANSPWRWPARPRPKKHRASSPRLAYAYGVPPDTAAPAQAQGDPTMNNPVGWFEIYVDDMPRAKAFYETVFGAP